MDVLIKNEIKKIRLVKYARGVYKIQRLIMGGYGWRTLKFDFQSQFKDYEEIKKIFDELIKENNEWHFN